MYGSLLQIKDSKKELFTHLFLSPGGSLTCKISISTGAFVERPWLGQKTMKKLIQFFNYLKTKKLSKKL